MVKWLQARQAGVEQGRISHCRRHHPHLECSDGSAVMRASNVYVYHGCEVHLVVESINSTMPNLIRAVRNVSCVCIRVSHVLQVVPHVALDTVSYSSYDAQSTPYLGQALDFIFAQMNRTAASPSQPVFITEWGLPLMFVTPEQALQTAQNVIGFAATKPYVSRVLHWQVINNELDNGYD